MEQYSVFNSLQDLVLVVNAKMCVVYGNASAAALFNVSRKRLGAGLPITDIVEMTPDPLVATGPIEGIKKLSLIQEVKFKIGTGFEGVVQLSILPEPQVFRENDEAEPRWIIFLKDMTIERSLHQLYRAELEKKESVIAELVEARARLEEYSKTLEHKVAERTAELSESNRLLRTILDSLGQGILVFDKDGVCLPIYSSVCKKLFDREPGGLTIDTLLGHDAKQTSAFRDWRDAIFVDGLDFETLAPLGPSRYRNKAGLEIVLECHPMRDANDNVRGIVLVATDKTDELNALRRAERDRELVNKVTQVARNREAFRLFVISARRLLNEMLNPSTLDVVVLARNLHTLKGSAASFALSGISTACHTLEDELKNVLEKGSGRREFNQQLIKKAEETIELLNREVTVLTEFLGPVADQAESQRLELPLSMLRSWADKLISDGTPPVVAEVGVMILRECTLKPIGSALMHVGPSMTELATKLGRRLAAFEVRGGELRVSLTQLEPLLSSLVHAYRNSLFHGIEGSSERLKLGKPAGGKIVVEFSAETRGNLRWLNIDVSDDGRGVDLAMVRAKLIEKGFTQAANGTDEQVLHEVLSGKISTAAEVTEVGGRGIGLSAIAIEAQALGGSIAVSTKAGQGTTISVRIPLQDDDQELLRRSRAA